MQYLDMLEDIQSMGLSIKIESAGSLWRLTIQSNSLTNESIDVLVDESLEALIGRAYDSLYLGRNHK